MRTLKKSLALVLALVMVLGLGVIGASADNALDSFTDANEVGDAYLEAMGVMTGLGVIDGVGTAAPVLDPDGTYTREQAAKIITYMLLGKDTAEALTATDTPFTDVPATAWSAKYISYCVEAGIIDGMTPTTFEPYATLTGYQWAKMLLSAVGFGAKGEFVGDSWSIGTATIARQVNLFKGDLAGGDHKPLQRQQAILYAFNALTGVNVVVYSEALGDYIVKYDAASGIDRFTYEGTLAANIYDLYSVTGILSRVEGAGNSNTVVSKGYSSSNAANNLAYVNADNDIDMLFHAARVWFIDADEDKLDNDNTAVYTYDLAKVTTYECGDITASGSNAGSGKAIDDLVKAGNTVVAGGIGTAAGTYAVYELDLIDNSAVLEKNQNNYYALSLTYQFGQQGTKHANGVDFSSNGTDYSRVSYDDVWTNIDNISRYDGIIFIRTAYGDGVTYHVYPTTSTSGKVVAKDNSTKTITLEGGTVLEKSAFAGDFTQADPAIGITYTFTLDTHGHYINWSSKANGQIVWYTGTCRSTSAHDAWSSDYAWAAQCVNVETGVPVDVPVSTAWKNANDKLASAGYYDVTDPDNITAYTGQTNPAYGKYMFKSAATTFNTTDRMITGVFSAEKRANVNVYINPETVTFVIATGVGKDLTTKTYTGVAALLKDYASADGINTITMSKLMITVNGDVDSKGNQTGVTVFAFPDYTSGGILYFPEDVATTAWIQVEDGYQYNGGYLSGTKVTPTIFVKDVRSAAITKGFYNFTVDKDGYWSLTTPVGTAADAAQVEAAGAEGALVLNYNGDTYNLTEATKVVDLRKDVPSAEHIIDSIEDMTPTDLNEVFEASLTVGFTWDTNKNVTVIYITDDGITH